MKKSIFSILLAISIALAIISCSNSQVKNKNVNSASGKNDVYSCPMHPEVTSDKPGDCPKCGMKLELVEVADSTHMHNQADTSQMK